jgi:hypothetical protein
VSTGLYILVPTDSSLANGKVRQHSGVVERAGNISRELVEDFDIPRKTIISQLGNMLGGAASAISGYEIDSVTVNLGIDAKGSIGVLSAGLTAAFEVIFAVIFAPKEP